ncbi:MAG: branched-chain amino acid aminotransferase [Defluviitaleaceae bacterium]|nr:branched-chain amino acid aminotransferase [Defluviitaleaceae bacterium]
MKIKIELTQNLKPKTALEKNELPFGQVFTDYMFMMDYSRDEGWHNAKITPYAPISLDPATSCLHYGQMFFEGMKAYKQVDGKIAMFRPMENMHRMNLSAGRMSMPEINSDEVLDALAQLVELEKDWIPTTPESSLYIRPFMFGTDPFLGVRTSNTYKLVIILSPVGPYYGKDGLAPVRIFVEPEYVRAVKGGTGFAKCAGNYAGTMLSQLNAQGLGFNQVLWLDGIHRKYIEEVGAMNVFFLIDGNLVTPELTGSILPGITRKSVIEICKDWGMRVEERPISIDELANAYDGGKLVEAFGSGTAAVVSPIGELTWNDKVIKLANDKPGELTQKIYDEITGIQYGLRPDTRGWIKNI